MSPSTAIYYEYLETSQNAKSRAETVNRLRHLVMDKVQFDVTDDDQYMYVYTQIMLSISSEFPSLSWEVKRQMAKKKRRQARRSLEKQEARVHI